MKPSGVEWVGNIPTDWDVEPFFKVMPQAGRSNFGLTEVNLLSLSHGQIVHKDIDSNDGLLPASFETYQIVEPGNIVFRFTDLQNDKRSLRSALVRERGIITSAYLAVSPTACLPSYADFLMRSYDTTKVFYSFGGGVRQSLKYSDVKRLPVLVPPIDTQRAIVEFLHQETVQIDRLIRTQQQLIDVLDERRSAVITHAVTRGLDPRVPVRASGLPWLGDVPEHWTIDKLGRRARIGNGSTPRRENLDYWFDGDIPWLNSSVVNMPNVTEATQFVTAAAVAGCHLPLVPAGSPLVGLTGQGKTRGMATLLRFPSTVSQHLAYVVPQDGVWSADFLVSVLRASYARLRSISDENGSTKGGLTCDDLSRIQVPQPPLSEQQSIVTYLDYETKKIDALIEKAKAMNLVLRERRSALISAAVTGKIDVTKRIQGAA